MKKMCGFASITGKKRRVKTVPVVSWREMHIDERVWIFFWSLFLFGGSYKFTLVDTANSQTTVVATRGRNRI